MSSDYLCKLPDFPYDLVSFSVRDGKIKWLSIIHNHGEIRWGVNPNSVRLDYGQIIEYLRKNSDKYLATRTTDGWKFELKETMNIDATLKTIEGMLK